MCVYVCIFRGNGQGENKLGQLLMELRENLKKMCKFPGCDKPCYVEPNGKVHDYCGRTHANQAKKSITS